MSARDHMRESMSCQCSLFLPEDNDKPNNKSKDVVWVRVPPVVVQLSFFGEIQGYRDRSAEDGENQGARECRAVQSQQKVQTPSGLTIRDHSVSEGGVQQPCLDPSKERLSEQIKTVLNGKALMLVFAQAPQPNKDALWGQLNQHVTLPTSTAYSATAQPARSATP